MGRAWMLSGLFLLSFTAWGQEAAFSVTPPAETYFQMGAYRTEGNAQSFAKSLVREGFQPRLRREGSLFRVYLSVKETEARVVAEALVKAGHTGFVQLWTEPRGSPIQVTRE